MNKYKVSSASGKVCEIVTAKNSTEAAKIMFAKHGHRYTWTIAQA